MPDFDARWKRLARAARSAPESEPALAEHALERLAALAQPSTGPTAPGHSIPRAPRRPFAFGELASLAATLAVALIVLRCALPDRAAWSAFTAEVAADLAALPDRVPRAPKLPSPKYVLDALPDFAAVARSFPFDVESSR